MQEINQKWRPLHTPTTHPLHTPTTHTHTLTGIPPLLMGMFHRALRPLLDYHSGCGGSLVLRWSHHHLHEAAVSTYLSYPPTAQARYNTLANYFAGGLLQRTADEAGTIATCNPTNTCVYCLFVQMERSFILNSQWLRVMSLAFTIFASSTYCPAS